ncbi:MAG TPA: SDR family oxidoreductase [Allosphingosinicella sp.]
MADTGSRGGRRQVVVVTGASAGIGRATVREFAKHGADIALLARGEQGLRAAACEVEAAGGRALAICVDMADAGAVDEAAARIEVELGPIDIWVNNAFAGMFAQFLDVTPEEYRRVTEVTYLGQVWGTRAALRHMLPRDRGSIVLVGSALAYRGIPLQSAYCGAKHATQGFLDSVRTELLARRSRVNLTMVQLPGVNTPQFDWVRAKTPGRPKPTGAIYQPEVAARAIRFAARSRRKEIYVGWPAYEAILADKMASSLADRYLARGSIEDQQSKARLEGERQDNLFAPVEGDRGAHGRFDRQSRSTSLLLSATMNRNVIALASIGLLGLGAAWWRGGRRSRQEVE